MIANLYNDLHPDKSLKNTGFKDAKTAIKTIKLVKKRSVKYQFDVINTMYNRAKYHPHRTTDMEKAMVIFKDWLNNYKTIKKNNFPFLTLSKMLKYEKLADKYNINKQFLNIYKSVNGNPYKLQYMLIDNSKPDGYDYWSYRIKMINKLNKHKLLFNKEGVPTKYHLYLIMHAYSPVLI
jgi:hypothetical protein